MFPAIRLKTKLVLAMTSMVVAVVATLSFVYVSQLVRQRIDEVFRNGEFVTLEVYQASRDALENDLANPRVKLDTDTEFHDAVEESLQTDAGLNSLLQSIIGYSPTIYDVTISDPEG